MYKIWSKVKRIFLDSLTILIISPIFISASNAEVSKWTDSNGVTYFNTHPPKEKASSNELKKGINNNDIVMYSTSWCPYCRKARNYFRKKGIPFTEYDVEKLPTRMREFKKLGGTRYPLILIGKNNKMEGFSIEGFEKRYYQ